MLEKGIKEAERLGSGQVVVVYDRRGYGKKNRDTKSMDTMKLLVPILQDYYPERLHSFFYLGANWFSKLMFELTKTFVSQKTLQKVVPIGDVTELLKYFEKENLSIEYGGIPESSKFGEKLGGTQGLIGAYGDDVIKSESEDEVELKKLADKLYS